MSAALRITAALQVNKGPAAGTVIPLDGDRFILGRNPDCGIVIPFATVSREHAQIVRVHGKYYIIDGDAQGVASHNFTWVNDEKVTTRRALKHNDKIRICDFLATFVERSGPPAEEPEDDPDSSTVEATLAPSAHTLLETQPAEKLRGLLEISASLSKTLDLDPLLPKIADSLFGLFRQADRCFLIVADEPAREGEKARLLPRVVRTRRAADEVNAQFSKMIVRRCIDSAQALLFDDAQKDERVQLSQSVVDFRIRSAMVVPLLRADGRAFGVIQLDTQDRTKKFKEEDLRLLVGVANQASIALENARLLSDVVRQTKLKSDLAAARLVQMSFLPSELPALPTYEFFAYYQPAQSVGGDYYGFIPLTDGRVVVAVGDVAGKGIPAALLMAKLSSDMRYCALTESDPARVVSRLNDLMYPFTNPMSKFVTLSLLLLDPAGHRHALVSAGHPSPLRYNPATGALIDIIGHADGGYPLGMLESEYSDYAAHETSLQPGEVLVLFSDGLTEPLDLQDREFGMDGIRGTVKGLGPVNAKTLVERIVQAVQRHTAGREPWDDITVLAVRRTA